MLAKWQVELVFSTSHLLLVHLTRPTSQQILPFYEQLPVALQHR